MIEHHITREAGHPWTGQGPWDLLEVRTTTEAELDTFLKRAEAKFWQVWIRGHREPDAGLPGQPCAALYKPSGARRKWRDTGPDAEGRPHVEWQIPVA